MATRGYDAITVSDLNRGYLDAERLLSHSDAAEVWAAMAEWPAERLGLALLATVSALDELTASTPRP